ncbi:MAG: GNAT family N-acetyltransferase [Myxococcaceae bacterium]
MTPLPEVVLTGSHVRLEPLRMSHLAGLLAAANEARSTYSIANVPSDDAAMRKYLEIARSEWERGVSLPFATIDLRGDRVVGTTRFGNIEYWSWPGEKTPPVPTGPDAVEIGWTWLAASAQRTAINSEAKLLMLRHAFETWGVRRVTLKTDARNARSRAAIERLGAKFDGILRAHMPAYGGGVRDSAYYSILRAEWPTVQTKLTRR